ncbi:MAG: cobalt-precorrin-6A reductase [Paracoccaceae bacterium]
MLLILGGTAEARALASAVAARGRPGVVTLAGVTRHPVAHALPVVTGGFGGPEGFLRFVAERGVTCVIDATHPFAARITARTAAICPVPLLRLERPDWVAGPGDWWRWIDRAEEAAALAPDAPVLLATGRGGLMGFEGLAPRILWCRAVDPDPGPNPLATGRWLIGRPPFDVASETALMRRLSIGCVIAKDAGGAGGRPKLDAARALGLPVILLRRPPAPEMPAVGTVEEALAWACG